MVRSVCSLLRNAADATADADAHVAAAAEMCRFTVATAQKMGTKSLMRSFWPCVMHSAIHTILRTSCGKA